jgi:hypothetical protein
MLRFTRSILGRTKKAKRASRASDNTPLYDKGPVEWIPRPARLPVTTIDAARNWMMRQTLDGDMTEINRLRDVHREWAQMPLRPVLGDVEPKLPLGVYKDNHIARRRFLYRWHKGNSPNHWMWLPKTGFAPERRQHASDYPENWKVQRDAAKLRSSS